MTSLQQNHSVFFSTGLVAVLLSQFLSAFADNALFFVALGLLKQLSYPDWSTSLLQMFFVGSYIVFAPFVGIFADSVSKDRVMMLSNSMKVVGCLLIWLGIGPFIGYTLVGIGAAIYSPAKYGILGELVSAEWLVKANGWIESSTIIAILGGSLLGGRLADYDVHVALLICSIIYGLSVIANLFIPKLAPASHHHRWNLWVMIKEFYRLSKLGLSDNKMRLSLIGTSLFWGAGITLRTLMFSWVPLVFLIDDVSTPTQLMGVVSIGIAIGAIIAAKVITLKNIYRVLPVGTLLGVIIIILMFQTQLYIAYVLLIIAGICGGFMVVPLNTLIQERGKETVGSGSAVALQNFFENLFMLLMLGLLTLLIKADINVLWIGGILGLFVLSSLSILWLWQRKITDW